MRKRFGSHKRKLLSFVPWLCQLNGQFLSSETFGRGAWLTYRKADTRTHRTGEDLCRMRRGQLGRPSDPRRAYQASYFGASFSKPRNGTSLDRTSVRHRHSHDHMASGGSPIKRFVQGDEYVFRLSGHNGAHGADLRLQAPRLQRFSNGVNGGALL